MKPNITSNQLILQDDPLPAAGYAGDISPHLAWQWLQAGQTVLVDVRTDAEREWASRALPAGARVLSRSQFVEALLLQRLPAAGVFTAGR